MSATYTIIRRDTCTVAHVLPDFFTVDTVDMSGEIAKYFSNFDTEDVSPEDREKIKLGARFVYCIRYLDQGGSRRRESFIEFLEEGK